MITGAQRICAHALLPLMASLVSIRPERSVCARSLRQGREGSGPAAPRTVTVIDALSTEGHTEGKRSVMKTAASCKYVCKCMQAEREQKGCVGSLAGNAGLFMLVVAHEKHTAPITTTTDYPHC